MRIKEDNKWKTIFKARYNHFEYQIILFGSFNTPTSFQRYINKFLAEMFKIFIIVCLNAILIYIQNFR